MYEEETNMYSYDDLAFTTSLLIFPYLFLCGLSPFFLDSLGSI
jgi:hypothetical protein